MRRGRPRRSLKGARFSPGRSRTPRTAGMYCWTQSFMERTYSDSSPTSSNVPQFVCASVRSAGSSRPCRPSTSARIAVATTSWKLSWAALRSIESTYALSILLRMMS